MPKIDKNKIATGFIGLKSNTTKAQMFRSIMNLLEFSIERSETSSTSSTFGAAFLAGLGAGLFESINELENFRRNVEIFKPDKITNYDQNIRDWETSLKRFTNWN